MQIYTKSLSKGKVKRDAATILDKLDGVRSKGPGRWMARCPAHNDKTASLSIKDTGEIVLCTALADAVIEKYAMR
jgi:hypothetical protein